MVDLIDRILEKGIVVDALVGVDLLGIGLHIVDIDARVVVASLDTYVRYAQLSSGTGGQKRTPSSAPERSLPTASEQVKKSIRAKYHSICELNGTDEIRAHGLGIRLDSGHRSNRSSSPKAS